MWSSAAEFLPHGQLDFAIGFGDRSQVRLGLDRQVGPAKGFGSDAVGCIAELEGKLEILS